MYTIKTLLLLTSLSGIKISNAQITPVTKDTITVDDRIFTKVEVEAEFPGGVGSWRKFLVQTLNGDAPADNGAPSGEYPVVVKFIVSKDGSISEISAETNFGFGMEEEVIRTIKKSGRWIAARQNGRLVNAYRRQPVTFVVTADGFDITSKVPYTLFMGTDNEIEIKADKVKPEDLQVTISKGSVKQTADGKYIVHVNAPGRVIIELYNTKKDKKIGAASFVVKAAN
jgi:hypothetical protein